MDFGTVVSMSTNTVAGGTASLRPPLGDRRVETRPPPSSPPHPYSPASRRRECGETRYGHGGRRQPAPVGVSVGSPGTDMEDVGSRHECVVRRDRKENRTNQHAYT